MAFRQRDVICTDCKQEFKTIEMYNIADEITFTPTVLHVASSEHDPQHVRCTATLKDGTLRSFPGVFHGNPGFAEHIPQWVRDEVAT